MDDPRLSQFSNCDFKAEAIWLDPEEAAILARVKGTGLEYIPVLNQGTLIWFRCLKETCGHRFRATFGAALNGQVFCTKCWRWFWKP